MYDTVLTAPPTYMTRLSSARNGGHKISPYIVVSAVIPLKHVPSMPTNPSNSPSSLPRPQTNPSSLSLPSPTSRRLQWGWDSTNTKKHQGVGDDEDLGDESGASGGAIQPADLALNDVHLTSWPATSGKGKDEGRHSLSRPNTSDPSQGSSTAHPPRVPRRLRRSTLTRHPRSRCSNHASPVHPSLASAIPRSSRASISTRTSSSA